VFAYLCVDPVFSKPQDNQYDNWFSRRSAAKESSLPPPPGGPPQTKLEACSLDKAVAVDEKNDIIFLDNTLLVNGCMLDCEGKIIRSIVSVGSIVKVRNGGHVKNCSVQLVKTNDFLDGLGEIPGFDTSSLAYNDQLSASTPVPTDWGSYLTTGESTEWATYIEQITNFIPNPVSGYICDSGDCILENSKCSAPYYDPNAMPGVEYVLQECVFILKGAADVRIQGDLIVDDVRPVSVMGIVANADDSETHEANVRLFVDDVVIRNQAGSGILIAGGANTVRISNSVLSNNGLSGISIYRRHGLKSFAVLGGAVENNDGPGIDLIAETSVFLSDVLVTNNREDGIKVRRVKDLVIDGATVDGNGMSGIAVWNAESISLQGVVSKKNTQNGISVEAEGSELQIANSLFMENGFDLGPSPNWKRAGIYTWLSKKITITNSVSNGNSMDGILIYDVTDLSFSDVDTMKNGNDGIEIRESLASYGYDYTANSDYLVGAYYYPWHKNDFHNGGGYLRKELDPPQSPALGEYDDSDPEVISQHLEWFRKSNIGLVVTSWWGPGRVEDTTTRDILMEHTYLGNLKVALHYETTGRIKPEYGDDMSVAEGDIQYMCENYFDHPNYYKIDDRPVLFIYISRKLEELGTLSSALLAMRTTASKCGHSIYIVGDAIFAKAPEAKSSFGYFDAVTNYDVYGSSGSSKRDTPYAGAEAIDKYYEEQEKWRNLAFEEDCRFIPPVSPGYNDRAVRLEKDNPPLSRRLTADDEEGSLFKYQLEKALPLTDPDLGNLIMVNSFNEWHEDTQIEPVMAVDDAKNKATKPEELTFGLEYVDYGELYLDILRNATTSSTPKTKEPDEIDQPYVSTRVEFSNVRSCQNEEDGMRFYITQNSIDDQTELIFETGPGVISCENEAFDYMMYGGGNVDFVSLPTEGIVGDQCANGQQALTAGGSSGSCDYANVMKDCQNDDCIPRDIFTIGGGIITDHKIE